MAIFRNIADNKSMIIVNGEKIDTTELLSVEEMAKREGKTKNAIKLLLHKKDERPICGAALYQASSYEAIRDAPPPGRPRKAEPEA